MAGEQQKSERIAREAIATEAAEDVLSGVASKLAEQFDEDNKEMQAALRAHLPEIKAALLAGLEEFYTGKQVGNDVAQENEAKAAVEMAAQEKPQVEIPEKEKPIRVMSEKELLDLPEGEDAWLWLERNSVIAIPRLDNPKYQKGYYLIPGFIGEGRKRHRYGINANAQICALYKLSYSERNHLGEAEITEAAFVNEAEFEQRLENKSLPLNTYGIFSTKGKIRIP